MEDSSQAPAASPPRGDPRDREPKDRSQKKKKSSKPKKEATGGAPTSAAPTTPASPPPPETPRQVAASISSEASPAAPDPGLPQTQELREGMLYLQASLMKQMHRMFESFKDNLATQATPALGHLATPADQACSQQHGPTPGPSHERDSSASEAVVSGDRETPPPLTPCASPCDSEEEYPPEDSPQPSRPVWRVSPDQEHLPRPAPPPVAPSSVRDSVRDEEDDTLEQLFPAFPIADRVEVGQQVDP